MKRMKIADLWDYLPPEARYVAMDLMGSDGSPPWYWFHNKPTLYPAGYWVDGTDEDNHELGIAIDYPGEWTDSLHERPQEIKPGMFGKFWNEGPEPDDFGAVWGYLRKSVEGEIRDSAHGWVYKYFRPCTPPAQAEI